MYGKCRLFKPVSFALLCFQDVLGVDNAQLRFIRAMKPLRWFKLMRIIRVDSFKSLQRYLMFLIGLSRKKRGNK
jgi:hypothetical protein